MYMNKQIYSIQLACILLMWCVIIALISCIVKILVKVKLLLGDEIKCSGFIVNVQYNPIMSM